ncbi:MAG: nitrate ABC transporter permease [Epsilonproteobacteria bacterium]|nr:nitrate ABC transporter permease [Campylobacterota bacterium]
MNPKQTEMAAKIILPLIVLFIIIQAWAGLSTIVEDFPTPSATYEAATEVFADPFYIESEDDKGIAWQVLSSLQRVFGGFALAIIVGVPVGLMVGMSKNFQYALDPYIQILKPVSPLAWLPLLLFVFRDIDLTAVSTIFITSIWPIIINTALGVRSVSEDYLNVAKVLQFNPMEKVTKIILPVAVPYIFTGMRLSLGIAWLVIVAAEMLTGGIGIGFWIWDEYNNLNYHNIIIGIIIVGIVGWVLDMIMGVIADFFDYRKKGRA